jgi:hypothetical protein
MAPADSWIEWFDHGNIDHYTLFNVHYIIMPIQLKPPYFLTKLDYDGAIYNKKTRNANANRRFQMYKVKHSSYWIVATRCHTHVLSMKYNNCLHPLFHDARPGRGYGRGFEEGSDLSTAVDDDWKYTMSAPPKYKKPPLTLYQMDHRKSSELPKTRGKMMQRIAGVVLNETIGQSSYSCNVQVNQNKLNDVENGIFVVLKVNYHPHWKCVINNGDGFVKDIDDIFRVAPGYLAVQLQSKSVKVLPAKKKKQEVVIYNVRCTYGMPFYKRMLLWIPIIIFMLWFLLIVYKNIYVEEDRNMKLKRE